MKELSIEQKAKAYDKAIRKAKDMLSYKEICQEDMEYLFPELAESEDDKMKKHIIEVLKDNFSGEDTDKCIAWLEKQDNQKPQGKSALEVIKEEKVDNANKIEPKFHKGEWVVWNNQYYKVNYNGCGYELVDQNGLSTSLEYGTVDQSAHAFSIKDAKDGDVLCTYECNEPKIVFILKGTPKKHYPLGYYCYYNIMYPHFASDSEKGCLAPNDEDIKPATKEQRDTLMKAMTDVGYTFDFEKKELKKIEQKTAEWSEEDENNILFLTSIIEECFKDKEEITLYGDTVCAKFTKEDVIDRLKSLKPHKQ